MRWVTAFQHQLHIQDRSVQTDLASSPSFAESIGPRAVHELLFDPAHNGGPPWFAAREVARLVQGVSAWLDPAGTFNPAAILSTGEIPARQMWLLRPRPADLLWTAVECLRCRGIGIVVMLLNSPLEVVQARKLQLAAEQGGAVGVVLRPLSTGACRVYAAATRWLVTPLPGDRTIQRWQLQFLHGHGRRLGQCFILEKSRDCAQPTCSVHSPARLAHPPRMSAAS